MKKILIEFFWFGIKQAYACLFAGLILGLILITHFLWPADAPIARYDFLLISAIVIQIMMLWTGLETREEAWVILIFHITGTVMEIFKTSMGLWGAIVN